MQLAWRPPGGCRAEVVYPGCVFLVADVSLFGVDAFALSTERARESKKKNCKIPFIACIQGLCTTWFCFRLQSVARNCYRAGFFFMLFAGQVLIVEIFPVRITSCFSDYLKTQKTRWEVVVRPQEENSEAGCGVHHVTGGSDHTIRPKMTTDFSVGDLIFSN